MTANSAPTASPQTIMMQEDSPKEIVLTGTDADGDQLNYRIVTPPLHGKLSGTAPTLVYQPNANFAGEDSFLFAAIDTKAQTGRAMVSIKVTPVNDPPQANVSVVTALTDTARIVRLESNDPDPGDKLSHRITAQPSHGKVNLKGNVATYAPEAGYVGTDSFDFTAKDAAGAESQAATVIVKIRKSNAAPVCSPASITVPHGMPRKVHLVGSDADGDEITYVVVMTPQHGRLEGTVGSADLTYTPSVDYVGQDSIAFKANDGFADSEQAILEIVVQ